MTDTFPPKTDIFPDEPILTLYIDGLALLCFNQKKKRAEIGFMTLKNHDVFLSLYDSKGKEIIHRRKIKTGLNRMTSEDAGTVELFKKGSDPRNFEHMYELSDLYTEQLELKPKLKYKTKFYIENAVFFTDPDSHEEVIAYEVKTGKEVSTRKTGQVLGIASNSNKPVLSIGSEKIKLKKGERYNAILATGPCLALSNDSDFKYFYTLLKNAGGKPQYNLKYKYDDFVWFSPFERLAMEKFTSDLAGYVKSTKSRKSGSRKQMLERLDGLKEKFCDPAPCSLATIGKKPSELQP